ncbi:SMC-Scp complex subunit ScpB [Halopseudomonas laoshanensis]|uniref:SMC-Scp complex subunit ScpB n=1 Tax=Halopseudomonas laoshanensis TaxID=2268758 RepID=A0A7V7GVC5_9GAMM|nr:SMC-Scp complex subunit ScpB [Halopseudomonas laoshanensis]KAA0696065.1 SMC-Scp complex subunit ScpB [Halopseudomonas laoshanensis]
MKMSQPKLEHIIEAALLAAGKPLSLDRLRDLFDEGQAPGLDALREALGRLAEYYNGRAIELREVASGWRLQVREEFSPWVSRLWEERPQRYSRAMLETLALIAYRQPITRGEIEDVRGVAVSSQIIKTLLEREWVRVVGHRDVPGRPSMYATTRQFLDHFNLRSLSELPPLAAIRDLDQEPELALQDEGAVDDVDTPWMPVEPLKALDAAGAETGFHALLDELGEMEFNLKTDFDDYQPQRSTSDPDQDDDPEASADPDQR